MKHTYDVRVNLSNPARFTFVCLLLFWGWHRGKTWPGYMIVQWSISISTVSFSLLFQKELFSVEEKTMLVYVMNYVIST